MGKGGGIGRGLERRLAVGVEEWEGQIGVATDKGGGVRVIGGADKAEQTGMGRGLVIGATGKWGETGSGRGRPVGGTGGGVGEGLWHGEGPSNMSDW